MSHPERMGLTCEQAIRLLQLGTYQRASICSLDWYEVQYQLGGLWTNSHLRRIFLRMARESEFLRGLTDPILWLRGHLERRYPHPRTCCKTTRSIQKLRQTRKAA